jgi:hypothetical protein
MIIAPAPARHQACGGDACSFYHYSAGPWGACDASCGGGTRIRDVVCVQRDDNTPPPAAGGGGGAVYVAANATEADSTKATKIVVEDSVCIKYESVIGLRPTIVKQCHSQACRGAPRWDVGEWENQVGLYKFNAVVDP